MSIYRGPGGAGDAVADSASEALLVRELALEVQADADAAEAAKVAALAAQAAAELAETNAETAEANAETAEANAETAEANAETAQAAAEAAQAAAETAQTAAELAETNAETAETNAEASATAAASSASAASTSASNAATSATNASNSASAASTSATNAANSASAAATSATNASNSASAASTSATAAQTAQTAAELAETNAETAETNAETAQTAAELAETNAETAASNAATSETNAAASASAASTSASNASTSATNASNSASAASTSATNASNSASAASTSATNAANSATDAAASAASINPSSIVITGGSINGTTVGASTASTGAFTSLSASGAFSANGGATLGDASGDALTINSSAVSIPNGLNFDSNTLVIDATNNRVGVGISAPAENLDVYGSQSTPVTIRIRNDNAGTSAGTKLIFGHWSGVDAAYLSNQFDGGTFNSRVWQQATGYMAFGTTDTERMRITSAGNVGIGTNSPAVKFHASTNNESNTPVARFENYNLGDLFVATFKNAGSDSNARLAGIEFTGDADVKFGGIGGRQGGILSLFSATGGTLTERMRIDSSGNVGIGTTSPNSKLDVATATAWGTATVNAINISNTGSGGDIYASHGLGSLVWRTNGVATASIEAVRDLPAGGDPTRLVFRTGSSGGGTERMRLDSSGNLGLGVTPSAWSASWKALQFGAVGAAFSSSGNAIWSGNEYLNTAGTPTYITTQYALRYRQDVSSGYHAWLTAPSGTAGNAITFTQAMTLDASGRLGIGTTSPSQKLQLSGSDSQYVSIISTDSGNAGVLFGDASKVDEGYVIYVNSDNSLRFGANNATERMRIDSSGNVGIGTSSPTSLLDVRGVSGSTKIKAFETTTSGRIELEANTAYHAIYCDRAVPLLFYTNGSERMRIDSSGNLLVGKTSSFNTVVGTVITDDGRISTTVGTSETYAILANRQNDDGVLVSFRQADTQEGTISVSGTTVSYNGGHLSRWSQLLDNSKDESILKGTVLSNLDEMCVWEKDGVVAENEQLNKMKVSDVEGDTNVAGVFVNWTKDEDYNSDDMNIAMTGDMIIRIAEGVTVQRGDLLMSAGDGTAKPQGDDIVRAKTIAKVTSTNITCTYADGSYCVPCVLMAC
jgi:hypothetical protein